MYEQREQAIRNPQKPQFVALPSFHEIYGPRAGAQRGGRGKGEMAASGGEMVPVVSSLLKQCGYEDTATSLEHEAKRKGDVGVQGEVRAICTGHRL